VPHPVGLWRRKDDFRSKGDGFRVLILFDLDSSQVRKNPELAVKAYLKAFEIPESGISLTIKISGAERASKALSDLKSLIYDRPDITLKLDKIPESEMRAFLASHNALLSLHRSEGFGLSLAEAMDLGLCVIATQGTGPEDYFNSDTGFVVPSRPVKIHDPHGPYAFYQDQTWQEADLDKAAEILKSLAFNPELRQAKIKSASHMIDKQLVEFQTEVLKALKA
jgi:glycosyltransferase involved in cell wall biosynthesis